MVAGLTALVVDQVVCDVGAAAEAYIAWGVQLSEQVQQMQVKEMTNRLSCKTNERSKDYYNLCNYSC